MNRIACLFWAVAISNSLSAQTLPEAHHYFSKQKHEHAANWSYTGTTGPAFWAKLDPAYQLGCNGKHQSPIAINLTSAKLTKLPALKFDYRAEKIGVLNNGHTIQHNGEPGSFLHVGDKTYSLEQFHLHSPSEHTLDGKSFPLEIHFVHKSKAGEVLVVAVFVQEDEKSQVSVPHYQEVPIVAGESVTAEGKKNPADYLPKNHDYFSYSGSFTTPPCTENVSWVVLKQPTGVAPKIIERFTATLKHNNRPLQKLNGRIVQR